MQKYSMVISEYIYGKLNYIAKFILDQESPPRRDIVCFKEEM